MVNNGENEVMQWTYLYWTVIAVSVTLDISINGVLNAARHKRDNFDILLSIYKMNPLKESNVFKTFSNTILLPRPDGWTPDMNFDSNESTKEKRVRMRAKLKQIEDAIHAPQLGKSIAKRPSLNIQKGAEGNSKPSEDDFSKSAIPDSKNSAHRIKYGRAFNSFDDKRTINKLRNVKLEDRDLNSYMKDGYDKFEVIVMR